MKSNDEKEEILSRNMKSNDEKNEMLPRNMKSNDEKKEILSRYKERKVTGGVYLIRNRRNDKLLLDAAADLQSIRNRFDFAQKTGSCVNPKLQKDWSEYGSGAFELEILEELTKDSAQTDAQFKTDVEFLKEIWLDKLSKTEELY